MEVFGVVMTIKHTHRFRWSRFKDANIFQCMIQVYVKKNCSPTMFTMFHVRR